MTAYKLAIDLIFCNLLIMNSFKNMSIESAFNKSQFYTITSIIVTIEYLIFKVSLNYILNKFKICNFNAKTLVQTGNVKQVYTDNLYVIVKYVLEKSISFLFDSTDLKIIFLLNFFYIFVLITPNANS